MPDAPLHLTYDDAILALQRAVMDKGENHRFEPEDPDNPNTYWYFNPASGECGCIVGQALSYFGITKETLGEYNQGTGFGSLLRVTPRVVTCDPEAKTLLQATQDEQDSGATWGEAVNHAVEYVDNNRWQIRS